MGLANIFKSEKAGGAVVEGIYIDSVKQVMRARVLSAPVETGARSFDNKVLDPYEVIVTATIVIDDDQKYKKTMQTLREMMANRSFSFYSVTDGVNFYENLIMTECPIEREASKFDFITVEIKFTQAMLVQKNSTKSENPENSDTRKLGYCEGTQQI
jgi:hypothetical protein